MTKGLVERLEEKAEICLIPPLTKTNELGEVMKEAAIAIGELTQELKIVTDTLAYLQGEEWVTIKNARKTLSKYQPEQFCEWAFNAASEAYAKAQQEGL